MVSETGLRLMPNRKDWQPEDTQVETAAMALRAQQMRLWNIVEDSATVGRCWQQTPVWLRCEYRQMASRCCAPSTLIPLILSGTSALRPYGS